MTDAAVSTVTVEDQAPSNAKLLGDIKFGMSQTDQKTLPTKLLYDETGSQLFDAICELPEYYPTRTELKIMKAHVADIAQAIGPRSLLIEPGSGSSLKTRLLLQHLQDPAGYVPLDISQWYLETAAVALAKDFPELEILPVCVDFTKPFEVPASTITPERRVIYFPGSTIGNFAMDDAKQLLETWAQVAGPGGGLLIGVDVDKDVEILKSAYNDAQGVTAKFNLNLLVHANRELGTQFDISNFEHEARYNAERRRIEMHLVSTCDQDIFIDDDMTVSVKKGESICTEYSHKLPVDDFLTFARNAGWDHQQAWYDDDRLFSLHYLRVHGDG